ncbi:hypothetical protein BHE74_00042658, partial [Ensete ventricosum]
PTSASSSMGNCFTKNPTNPAPAEGEGEAGADPVQSSAPDDAPIQKAPIPTAAFTPPPKPAAIGPVLGRPMEDVRTTYSLGKELGRGQFGVTHLCTHKATGEKLACKTIAKRKLTNKEDIEDVRREVQIMYHLSGQPNIVELKGAYEDKQSVHLVMELCAGGELFDRIIARGHYTERAAASLLRTIVQIVHTCHSMGVMHRDLKPENFLLLSKDEDAPLKATDFGLSVFFKQGEVFKDIVGSAYYIAPEVLKRRYGPEADIWSIGYNADHPWIKEDGEAPDTPLDNAVLNRLKQFTAMNHFKKAALRVNFSPPQFTCCINSRVNFLTIIS